MKNMPGKALFENARKRSDAYLNLKYLVYQTGKPLWATPILVSLGLLSSLAEALGITLILAFFYSGMDHINSLGSAGGIFGPFLSHLAPYLENSKRIAFLVMLLIALRGVLSYLYRSYNAKVSNGISEALRNAIHEQYLTASYGYLQKFDQAQLMETLGTEPWNVAGCYSSFTRAMVNAGSIIFFLVLLSLLSWQITLTALLGSVLISYLLSFLSGPANLFGQNAKEDQRYLGENMLMTLEGLRTIRAYGLEEYHHQRFLEVSKKTRRTTVALAKMSSIVGPLTEFGYLAILCIIMAFNEVWGTGFATTLATVGILYRLQPHLAELEGNLLYITQMAPQLRSTMSMVAKDDKEYPYPGHLPMPATYKNIRFQDISFSYDKNSANVLSNVTFDIPAGKTTSIYGASGVGKTTIVNLLLKLYQPTSGVIKIDDIPLNDIHRQDWLSQIAIAGQDVELIEGTVLDNIRMADIFADDESILAAAKLSGSADFIEPLPDGYHTWIGQQGMRFSGGQRQRLGLARAILRNSQFLILDEAMNALDARTRDKIHRSILRAYKGRTILLISHNLESAVNADHIICLENGRVVAEGSPESILQTPDNPLSRKSLPLG